MKKQTTKPSHQPAEETKRQIETLSGFGLTQDQIALVIGLSPPTLRKYYEHEISSGKAKACAQIAKTLFQQATKADKPNMSAAIFWLKCQAGWKENQDDKPGKKEIRQGAAEEAAQGKFKPAPPPLMRIK